MKKIVSRDHWLYILFSNDEFEIDDAIVSFNVFN